MIDCELLPVDQLIDSKFQRGNVFYQIIRPLLEAHEDARFAVFGCTLVEEGDRKERLATSRAATDESRPAGWETSTRQIVETGDSGRGFVESPKTFLLSIICAIFHYPPLFLQVLLNGCAARNPRYILCPSGRGGTTPVHEIIF